MTTELAGQAINLESTEWRSYPMNAAFTTDAPATLTFTCATYEGWMNYVTGATPFVAIQVGGLN